MMQKLTLKSVLSSFLVGVVSYFSCFGLNAAELDLSASPLFAISGVEPNVYLILDDSGSMDWELMVGDATDYNTHNGLAQIDDTYRIYMHPSFNDHWSVVPTVSDNPEAWMLRNSIVNPLYYNPKTTYYPWPGTDANGDEIYEKANPTAALEYPQNSDSPTANLTINTPYTKWWHNGSSWVNSKSKVYFSVYYNWIDDDGDGVVGITDSYQEVEIKPANTALFDIVDIKEADGSISTRKRTYTEEMQNFANWFQYYRKREFLAKVAIGHVIDSADSVRMGLALINEGHIFDASTMTDKANVESLLGKLYGINSSGGTPLRAALKSTGEMFRGNGSVSSPILSAANGGACQKNFQVLMTDSYWNGSDPGFGNVDSDGDTAFDGGNYADTHSDTLADVAMFYYENDLATTLPNDVPTVSNVDQENHQHLVTYTVAFGLKGNLDYEALDPDTGAVTWPDPMASSVNKIDDLRHAAYNGRGQYLNAAYPEQLMTALDKIIENIGESSATASAVAINSAKLTTDTVIYLAEFNTLRWQGKIYAYKILDTETGDLKATPEWEAADKLTDRNLANNPRILLTYNGSQGVAFQWDDITEEQKDDLRTNSAGGTDSEAEARLDYIRGDRSNEADGFFFRERATILGDIVNSGPVYVAEPNLAWPDTAPFPTSKIYSQFQEDEEDRDGVIYVSANDGMLHAFAEDDGEELFAYIPNILFSTATNAGMHYTTSKDYAHTFYNDLTPSVSDVYISTSGDSDNWATVLIGGLRGGGRGIFALNITDPDNFTESNASDIALWEFSNADDQDLGYTFSKPQIALANNGEWVAIFGNGYNAEGSGESALFIVNIEAGINGWQANDYIKISTGSGSVDDVNGLSTPVLLDTDGDGDVDRVYAGDLNGQLWVFDLSSSSAGSWGLADSKPLFTTIGNQPITAKPALSLHPTVDNQMDNEPNILVFFGTGQYLETTDILDFTQNHYYGVWDSGSYDLTHSSLVEQSVDSAFKSGRVMTHNKVDYSTKKGWYFELDETGERSVTTAVVRFDVLFFNTLIPNNNVCSSGGYGFRMAVNAATGGALDDAQFDSNGDGVVDKGDTTSDGSNMAAVNGLEQEGYLPEPVFIEDFLFTADKAIKVSKEPKRKFGRLSWQELLQ